MIISALVIVGYTTLGGFLAASTTDFIQSIIMSIALVIVFVFGISTAGGIEAVADHARSLPGYLTMFTTYDPTTGTEQAYPLLNIISMLAWGLDISECRIFFFVSWRSKTKRSLHFPEE